MQINRKNPLQKLMIHLSSAQVFDFCAAKAVLESNFPLTQNALKASLNMFDFSPTVVSSRAFMRRALRVVGAKSGVIQTGLNQGSVSKGSLSQGSLNLSMLSAPNGLHPAWGVMK